jgi:deoxyribonuclease V
MVPRVDLYSVLRALLEQIPLGMISTPRSLAEALGDPVASKAVIQALEREEMKVFSERIVTNPGPGVTVFTGFDSNEPLRRLAEFQLELADRVVKEDCFCEAKRYAGADAAYHGDESYAACVVMDGELGLLGAASESAQVRFPYIPGYLMFREAPVIEAAARQAPGFDVLFVNGHGVAHPRGCGLASCVGLDLDVPTIGVARRLLVGNVGEGRGGWAPLIHENEVVGAEVEAGGSRVYVSVGHKVSLETSVKIVQKLTAEGRFPEPLRRAHMEAAMMLKRKR